VLYILRSNLSLIVLKVHYFTFYFLAVDCWEGGTGTREKCSGRRMSSSKGEVGKQERTGRPSNRTM